MGYLNDRDGEGDGISLVFLPARAANVAVFFASLASVSALAMLIRAGTELDISGGKTVLVVFLAVIFLFWASTGLVLAYARWLPPPDSRLWQLVASTTSYLSALWIVSFALTVATSMELLFPLIWCEGAEDDLSCHSDARNVAIQTFCALLVALMLDLVLAVFVTFDLRNSRHSANVLILRAEMMQQRRQGQLRLQHRQQQMRAGWEATSPLLLEPGFSSEEEAQPQRPSTKQEREQQKEWVTNAFLARAKEPAALFLPPPPPPTFPSHPLPPPPRTLPLPPPTPSLLRLSQPPFPSPPAPKDALGVPALFSMGHGDHHRSRSRHRSEGRRSSRHRSRSRSRESDEEDRDEGEEEGRGRARSKGGRRGRSRRREDEDEGGDENEDEVTGGEEGKDGDEDDRYEDTEEERRRELHRARREEKEAGARRHEKRQREEEKRVEERRRRRDEEEDEDDGGEKTEEEEEGEGGRGRTKERDDGESTGGDDDAAEEKESRRSRSRRSRSRSRKRDENDEDDESGGDNDTESTSRSLGAPNHSRSHHSSRDKRHHSRSHSRSSHGRHRSSSPRRHRHHSHSRDGRASLSEREEKKQLARANQQNLSGTMAEANALAGA
ncbi:hypothetical protein JCM6882_008297 [Rhodosporidiobolus microsporus]